MSRTVLDLDLATLRQRSSVKWRAYPPDVLPLWVAEMDVLPAPPVVSALERAARVGDLGYATSPPYLEAVARWAGREWGWEVDADRARLVTDVMTGIAEVLRAATTPGAPVVVTTPVYEPFHDVVREVGRDLVTVPLDATGRLDLAALERSFRALSGRGAAMLLCNPHNPTGTVPTPDELTALAELAHEHAVTLVSDEIHAPLVLPGATFTPLLSLPAASGAITVISPAKGWSLAGLKAAAVVPGPDADEVVGRIPPSASYAASHVAVQAHVAAMDHGQDWLDALVVDLAANRDLLGDLLRHHLPDVRWRPQEGTYLAWLDCRELGLGDNPARHFLKRARVALNAGATFGEPGRGFVRLNTATSPEILTEAVQRMAGSL